VAGKVVAIICAFTDNHELSNAEITRLTGPPVSTAHRLLDQLVVGGMSERTTHRQYCQYRVGPTSRPLPQTPEPLPPSVVTGGLDLARACLVLDVRANNTTRVAPPNRGTPHV
jgi:hypothetical protein